MNKILYVIFIVLFVGISFADTYITQDIVSGCDETDLRMVNNKTKLVAVFEPIEYTCDAGYFLPANTTGCVACPSGFTCSGGTFAFNETSASGISAPESVSQTKQKVCSNNLLHTVNNTTKLKAVFVPNTVNLNWDDGSGNTISTTCEYDGTITVPTEPTRLGYTFTGWNVKTKN